MNLKKLSNKKIFKKEESIFIKLRLIKEIENKISIHN